MRQQRLFSMKYQEFLSLEHAQQILTPGDLIRYNFPVDNYTIELVLKIDHNISTVIIYSTDKGFKRFGRCSFFYWEKSQKLIGAK